MTNTKIEPGSSLYLHPSEGTHTISVEKLEGPSNYRSWKRSFEISLASKRKLGFVTGGEKKDSTDEVKSEAWETCNNMVISWILTSVSESIKKSVMFVTNAAEIWRQLERRFSVANGARKYKLHKAVYETKQQGRGVAEYYTEIKSIWEELDALRDYPAVTKLEPEVVAYIGAVQKEEEEERLFQFLNGLDECFGTQRSHILMMTPLPNVETVCGMVQQEESQRDAFSSIKQENEVFAMYSKRSEMNCSNCGKVGHGADKCWACKACGKTGHTTEKCWTVVGFPSKLPKSQREFKGKSKEVVYKGMQGRDVKQSVPRWNKGKQEGRVQMSANVCSQNEGGSNGGITAQQLEQLLKLLPLPSRSKDDDSGDEMETNFAEMIKCNLAQSVCKDWILDSGATHHMTGNFELLENPIKATHQPSISLPNGETSLVSHSGETQVAGNMKLHKVMYIPSFRHNLVSIQKLTQHHGCKVLFHPEFLHYPRWEKLPGSCYWESCEGNILPGE
ncbi:uncharacterized protein LOC130590683 [Beta vulgaris subsp. vulgaris]|uniref:uncharacterized protein LOC130590683 n=1 Tax=Beta vulgaris subsp. vulgaris TaxID=3555 RepID=UPI002546C660|nr:uncharacterized protein LOC130590683 [Beta vulgaris subsp. vulgaris]